MTADPTSDRDELDQIADSFVQCLRSGQRPSIEEFSQRYPEHADQLRELLPALVLLETAGPDDTAAFAEPNRVAPLPREIGEFSIIREIGRGGMGVVYEAVQQSLGRHVALKVLSSPGLLNPTHLERFRFEARAAARLHHTHIVPVFGVGEHEGLHFYAMQFIQGQSLDLVFEALRQWRQPTRDKTAQAEMTLAVAEGIVSGTFVSESPAVASAAPTVHNAAPALAKESQFPPAAAAIASTGENVSGLNQNEFTSSHGGREFYRSVARVGFQVAGALAYAHSEGILHRDIKPSNLLLDAKGNVWVTDFGLAREESSDGLTKTGDFVGTLRYMAPERLDGWSDRRSDLYSLGATLYELLTLRPFLESESRGKLVEKILHENPPPPSRVDRQIPRDLETIVLKAISKEPAARYHTAEEMADDLQRFLGDRAVLARRTTPTEQLVRWCRRNPVVAGLLATVAATLLIGIVTTSYFAALASREARAAVRSLEEAQRQRQRAELVNQFFMNEVFGQADPNIYKRAGISLVQALDTAANRIDEKFPDDPELRAMLQSRLGEIYSAMGEPVKALIQLESAYELWKKVAGELDPRTLNCRSQLGNALSRANRNVESKETLRATLADQTTVLGPNHLDTLGTAIFLGYTLMAMADEKDVEQTESTYRQALEVLGPNHPTTFEAEYSYSWVLRWRGRRDQAMEHARAASKGLQESLGSEDIRSMFAVYNYAACLQEQGRMTEAVAELEPLLEMRQRVLGPTHTDTLWTAWRLASVLEHTDRSAQASAVLGDVVSMLLDRSSDNAGLLNGVAFTLATSSNKSSRNGQQAVELATRACELTEYKDSKLVDTLAAAYAETGDLAAVRKWSQKAVELSPNNVRMHYWAALRILSGGDRDAYRDVCRTMARQFGAATDDESLFWLGWSCGLAPNATDDYGILLESAETIVHNQPTNANYLGARGVLLYRSGEYESATTCLADAIAADHAIPAVDTTPVYSQFFLAMAHWQLGQKNEARQLLNEAQKAMDEELKTPSAWNRQATLKLFRREAEALIQPLRQNVNKEARRSQ